MVLSVVRQVGTQIRWGRPQPLVKKGGKRVSGGTYQYVAWDRARLADGNTLYEKTTLRKTGAQISTRSNTPEEISPQLSTNPSTHPETGPQPLTRGFLKFRPAKFRVSTPDSRSPPAALPYSTSPQGAHGIPIFRNVSDLRNWRRQVAERGHTVALVPTMGALHGGHMSLVRQAATIDSEVCISIYVNPTQFGVNEDLASYPETFKEDMQRLIKENPRLEAAGCTGRITAVFAPTTQEMYPGLPPTSEVDGEGSFVNITPLGKKLEGAARPIFFRGVATVVMKLLNIVQPEHVYFGQKDIQQVAVVQRMIKDFHLNTQMHVVGIARTMTGLAMSSRNVYLGPRRLAVAPVLYNALIAGQRAMTKTNLLSRKVILSACMEVATAVQHEQLQRGPTEQVPFEVEYLSLADPVTMDELQEVDLQHGAILSGVVKMLPLEKLQPHEKLSGVGDRPVRIIDNVLLGKAATFKTMGIVNTEVT